ncbi:hypothetical protein EYT18_21655 [Salmonella enterica]|uniref:hypothetical protein n=1 Tax=Erwinia amylovora TaxID=552 RepID=UPI001DF31004|nr:hypothetical protein [Erwinia amylovora]EAQ0916003.1 hypothetical protein [Salmonella enterica]EJW9057443.1 hypothetical protein [Salmonella enterica]ELA5548127.1 hypothetical protein [Salmonella enterica]ELE3839896.1 hypothetical protein [Salmonella enterica]MCK8410902.1 hypothetical protein [Erwinia amylovora]
MSQLDYSSQTKRINTVNPQADELPLLTVAEYESIIYARPHMVDFMAAMLSKVMDSKDFSKVH